MCYCCGHQHSLSPDDLIPSRNRQSHDDTSVVDLRSRFAETEARLERVRALEAELNRRLEEMNRFVSVMEILVTYLKRRLQEQQEHVGRLSSRLDLLNSV
ncbi:hypothetical protein P3X46_012720 [Hevea brasiliensis]|uniref:Protein SKIP34 n=1 Tax=Hevea brasiliensis TaxID=3981 RepID=A0ABQ9MF24_HEVBR|nr:protein SKIP34 [Hevea brasiliensis]KAJ9177504.1 hypothetical protein P3X46_012720 [Hevea brasiliensis]